MKANKNKVLATLFNHRGTEIDDRDGRRYSINDSQIFGILMSFFKVNLLFKNSVSPCLCG